MTLWKNALKLQANSLYLPKHLVHARPFQLIFGEGHTLALKIGNKSFFLIIQICYCPTQAKQGLVSFFLFSLLEKKGRVVSIILERLHSVLFFHFSEYSK